MTKQDRTTLKSFFRDGALPTAEHYRDLIDSNVNQVEDGFAKTPLNGLMLNSVGSSLKVLSLYQGLSTPIPSWVIEHGNPTEGQAPGALHFMPQMGKQAGLMDLAGLESDEDGDADQGDQPEAIRAASAAERAKKKAAALARTRPADGLTLTRDGRTGVNLTNPDWRLDVGGVARMTGRIGVTTEKLPEVEANGEWHDITRPMTGCQAFEVMAGAGGEVNAGHYALLHAIAMNAYHPRNPILNWIFGRRRIRSQTAVYGSYADRLKLKWEATEERHHFKLRLKSNADYGGGKKIRYYLTRLWFDTAMTGSRGGADRDPGLL